MEVFEYSSKYTWDVAAEPLSLDINASAETSHSVYNLPETSLGSFVKDRLSLVYGTERTRQIRCYLPGSYLKSSVTDSIY